MTKTTYEHIVLDEHGVPIIEGTTTKVIELVVEHTAYGWSPEEIHFQHPYLALGQIYSALAYYADHAEELDREIERRFKEVERLRRELGPSPLVKKLREKELKEIKQKGGIVLRVTKLASALLIVLSIAVVSQTDEQLIQKADQARFIEANSYVMSSKVIAERPDGKGEALMTIYNKRFSEGVRTRVEFLAPESMKGTIYLVVGDDIYFWQPGLLQPIRISGQQKIFGDASIAEAAGIQFSGKYAVKNKQEERLDGREALKLSLEATSERVAFAKVTLWLDKRELKPLQAILHAVSGEPLKKTLYTKYAKLKDDEYAAEIAVEDLLFKNFKTTIQISEVKIQDLPDGLFDPQKLGRP